MGLTATVLPCEAVVRDVEVGGPPFLPKEACLLKTLVPGLLCRGVTPESMLVLCGLRDGRGLHSGRGLVVVGLVLDCVFFTLGVRPGTGGGEDVGAAGGGWGEVG